MKIGTDRGVSSKSSTRARVRPSGLHPLHVRYGSEADIVGLPTSVRQVPQADIAIDLLALGVGNGRDPFATPLDHSNLLDAERAMLT